MANFITTHDRDDTAKAAGVGMLARFSGWAATVDWSPPGNPAQSPTGLTAAELDLFAASTWAAALPQRIYAADPARLAAHVGIARGSINGLQAYCGALTSAFSRPATSADSEEEQKAGRVDVAGPLTDAIEAAKTFDFLDAYGREERAQEAMYRAKGDPA